jgi:two-component system, cell cycle sensor histidine kinase and response regulator CckA
MSMDAFTADGNIAARESYRAKILLVDDSTENLIALEAVLETLGQNLIKATSGFEALRHLLEEDFAAIILDVKMPEMDGFETAQLIRSRKRSQNTPILFLTGFRNEEHLFRGYDLGAVDFLFKPIVAEILQSKVSVFVELSKNAALLKSQAEEIRALNVGLERKVNERTAELIRDIAERKHTEAALRESEQRLRVAIEAADLGLWDVDVPSETITCSARMREMFGFEQGNSPIELDLWKSRLASEDFERATIQMAQALAGDTEYDSEFRITRPDKSLRWIASRGRLLNDQDGASARLAGVAQDITERRNSEELIRHKQKLESMGILAGGIAHDFNNLLTGILGHSSLLFEDQDLSSTHREWVGNIVQAAENAAQLTGQMLAYSGRGRFVVESTSLSRRVGKLRPLLQASVPKNVRLEFELADQLPPVELDAAQLQQLVMNLVINGSEAVGPAEGFVRVSTRSQCLDECSLLHVLEGREIPAGDYVALEVQDNGHGMDLETQSKIFDPFFTTKFTGRGLGLAAVLGIVRGHKGAIRLVSEPGSGTTFTVFFPPTERAEPARQRSLMSATSGSGCVLVVDDEEIVRRTARISLEHHGFTVLLAENGAEAIEVFKKSAADVSLVLLDMAMPVMSGEQAFPRLIEIRPDVPVIASSGYDQAEALARFGHGLAGFLQKPYTARQLAAKVIEIATALAQNGS